MNNKNQNVLERLLKQLRVKFTNAYVAKLYQENPYKDSLFGLSRMLADYQVETKVIKMHDKEEIRSLEVPFVAAINGEIALVDTLTDKQVSCQLKGMDVNIPIEEFKEVWGGVTLLAEKTEETVEPGYKQNYIKQLFRIFLKKSLGVCLILLALTGIIMNGIYTHPGLLSLLFVNLIGGYIGYLLVQKQLYIQSDHADKICSLIKKGNCDDVLYSPAAKFLGIIGWSEVGFSYFISNILVVLLFPHLVPYLALINIGALPYSIWSIWYQKFKAKQWCSLCLMVQLLLWMVFIVNLMFRFISFPPVMITQLFLAGIIYMLPFILISISLPVFSKGKQLDYALEDMHKLRMKPEVFSALLTQQPHYEVSLSTSKIIWGNKEAPVLITIFTNPHCPPCAELHESIEKLLDTAGDKICVQYLFSLSDSNLESCRFLAATYLSKMDPKKKKEIFNEWFETGRNNKEEFFNKYGVDENRKIVQNEINRHKKWGEYAGIHATPTILINGYELPYYYKVEDILYFTGMKD